jgi:hypothetical protein
MSAMEIVASASSPSSNTTSLFVHVPVPVPPTGVIVIDVFPVVPLLFVIDEIG